GTRVWPQREVVVAREHGELERMALPHDVLLRLQGERDAVLLTGADRRRLTAVVPILRIRPATCDDPRRAVGRAVDENAGHVRRGPVEREPQVDRRRAAQTYVPVHRPGGVAQAVR